MALPNLKAEMARKGVTYQELSDELNIARSTVVSWMNGDTEPTVKAMFRIADFFGIEDLRYLFNSEPITKN